MHNVSGEELSKMDNTGILVCVMTAIILLIFILSAIILYRNFRFKFRSSTSISSSSRYSTRSPVLPLGTLGWPFIGETIQFISSAYSDRPETFMDKRRHMYVHIHIYIHIYYTSLINQLIVATL